MHHKTWSNHWEVFGCWVTRYYWNGRWLATVELMQILTKIKSWIRSWWWRGTENQVLDKISRMFVKEEVRTSSNVLLGARSSWENYKIENQRDTNFERAPISYQPLTLCFITSPREIYGKGNFHFYQSVSQPGGAVVADEVFC